LPNWKAPEIITKGVYSFKSDIWSFGCVLIELLTGMPPYPGLTSSKVTEWLSYGGNKLTKYQKRNEVSVLFKYLFGLNKSFKENCFVLFCFSVRP